MTPADRPVTTEDQSDAPASPGASPRSNTQSTTRAKVPPVARISVDEFRDQLAHLPLMLSLQQAAEVSGLSKATLRRRIASGELRKLKSRECRGGRLRILRDDLARLLAHMST